jgi:glycosyltransferase involved in cell wall biosynthesis
LINTELSALAAALARRGADVTVYTCRPGPAGVGRFETDDGYRVVHWSTGELEVNSTTPSHPTGDAALSHVMGDFTRFLAAEWATVRPDVVHADGWLYGVASQLAADHNVVPTVQALPELSSVVRRRQDRSFGPPARPRFERLLARGASRVAASCAEDVVELVKLGCARTRVSVLPHGVDLATYTTTGHVAQRFAEQRIVAVGSNLLPYKGFDDLIGALQRLPVAELIIVGGPPPARLDGDPDASRLRRAAIDHGVAGRVHLTGAVPPSHVPEILRTADVFACPSWYEPVARPLLEAMACGVPVVAAEAGAMLDAVVHEVTGLLVLPRNARRLSAALHDVLRAGALRNGMGLAGRARATACFGWDRVATEAETIYERAVATPRADPRVAVGSLS